jgi:hypothetical protein
MLSIRLKFILREAEDLEPTPTTVVDSRRQILRREAREDKLANFEAPSPIYGNRRAHRSLHLALPEEQQPR